VLRAVIDTTIFVRALINPKSRCGRLLFQYADRYVILMTKPIARELLEVIQRPELTAKYRSLSAIGMREIIDIIARAEAVEIGEAPRVTRDPDDDMCVATAVADAADYIVSEEQDLLSLERVGQTRVVNSEAFICLFET